MSRRSLAALVAILASVPALGAAERSKNHLTLAWEDAPRTIDPRYAVDANSQYLENLIHCALVDFDENGATIGVLASSWKWNDPTTLEVALKPAKYSDGTSVSAADVVATYSYFKKEGLKNPSPRQGAFAKLSSVAASGKDKVIFKLQEPDSTFVTNLVVGILPEKLGSGDMISETTQSVGCGPFLLTSMEIGGLELTRNPHYQLGPAPKPEAITIKIVKDETTRFAKLRAGEVDIVQNAISRDVLDKIGKQHPGLKVHKRPGLNTAYVGFNMRDKIVGDVRVRQAIAHAIDKKKIIKYVLQDLAIPANTLLTPNDPYYNKSVSEIPYDPEKAMKLLDEAGYKDPDGKGDKPRFELTFKTTTDTTRVTLAKAIAADLRKVGIKVTVQPLEWGRFKADVDAGKVQMWSLKWVGFKDPDIFRFCFATESFPPTGGNRGWYSNPELDKLLSEAKTKTDFKGRKAAYDRVQEIVAQELPYVFLWHEEIFAVMSKDIEGFELYADGRFASLARTYRK